MLFHYVAAVDFFVIRCVVRRGFTICGSVEWGRQTMPAQGTLCSVAYDWIFVIIIIIIIIIII